MALRRQARLRPRRGRLRSGDQARSEIRAVLSQPRPALAGQKGLRPRHRRLRSGDPSRARQCGGGKRPRHHASTSRASSTAPSPISTGPSRSNPKTPTYYDNRGNVWRDRGRFDRAVEDYDKAIALSPSFAFAFYNRSQAHYLAGRFTEALADAGKAAALNENSAAALSLRGLIHEKLGARDAAIADLRRAAALDPGLSQAVDALRRMGVPQ